MILNIKKPMNNNLDIQKSEEEIINEALLGRDEEIDAGTAEEILASYNISCEDLVIDFKLKIQQELRENYDKPEKVVISQNLGRLLKSISNYQRANDVSQIGPKTWVQNILDNTLNIISSNKTELAFRNKNDEENSENDNKVIDELKSDLDKE